jgi:hypothetical protein
MEADMSDPRDPLSGRRTDPIPSAETPSTRRRDPTLPLPRTTATTDRPSAPRTPPKRPSTTRWLVIGLLVLAGVFFLGYLVGNAGDEDGTQGKAGGGCRRAAVLTNRLVALHREALVNRTQFVEAALRDDEERVAELNAALDDLNQEGQELEGRAEQALERCRS